MSIGVSSRLYVFDWDGTLIDSVSRIVLCLRRAAEDLGLEDCGDAAYGDVIGLGLPEAIARLYPRLDRTRSARYREQYAAHFVAVDTAPSPFFPGALDVLHGLRAQGHLLAVATGKSRHGLDRVLHGHQLNGFFDATRCADETASKPDPRMLREILVELGVEPAQAVVVGDTEYDLEMARRAGAHGVAVSYGVHAAQRLAQHEPARIIDSLAELIGWWPLVEPPDRGGAGLT